MGSTDTAARHITDVGGMEILGLGSDFDGIPTNPALPGAEAMPVLWDRLKTAGFTENQLDGIFWGNVMRYIGMLCELYVKKEPTHGLPWLCTSQATQRNHL